VIIMTRKINFRSVRITALVGAGALAASLAVAIPLASHNAHADHPGRTPVAAPAGPSPQPGDAGPVSLVHGDRWADGLALGYPDTRSGALSAGLEYTTAFVECLDPDRLRAVLHDIAAPGQKIAADPVAVARSDRALVGAPASGPLPAGTALVLTGRMYQLLDFDQHGARLLLLFTMAASGPNAPDLSGKVLALPARLSWVGGDWKLAAWDGGTNYRTLVAAPDSTAAYNDGWLDLPSAADGPGSWS
jgi:hypothetical protein